MVVRQLEYTIEALPHPLTVEQYLRRKGFSVQNCKELKKKKGLLLRNGEVVFTSAAVSEGDRLLVSLEEEQSSRRIPPVFPTPEQLQKLILYEDQDILVVNKPPGMPIHPSMNHSTDALANLVVGYYEQQGRPFVYRCVNRLDQDTSGVTVIAKHFLAAGNIGQAIKEHSEYYLDNREQATEGINQREDEEDRFAEEIGKSAKEVVKSAKEVVKSAKEVVKSAEEIVKSAEEICNSAKNGCPSSIGKEYLAILAGMPPEKKGRLEIPLGRKEGSVIERMADFENGEPAITDYEVLETIQRDGEVYSLMKLRPLTGRTHQLRIHMRCLGCPIIGDYLYAPEHMKFMKRQALHAYRMRLCHPITGVELEFVAPLPEDMDWGFNCFKK